MASFKNVEKGPRGIRLKNGSCVIVDPGTTRSVPGESIASVTAGLIAVDPQIAPEEQDLPPSPANLAQLDHDNDGKPGGSKPHDPPALSGLSRADLEALAQSEGVLIEHIKGTGANGNVLAGDIKAAIEVKRKASAV